MFHSHAHHACMHVHVDVLGMWGHDFDVYNVDCSFTVFSHRGLVSILRHALCSSPPSIHGERLLSDIIMAPAPVIRTSIFAVSKMSVAAAQEIFLAKTSNFKFPVQQLKRHSLSAVPFVMWSSHAGDMGYAVRHQGLLIFRLLANQLVHRPY